MFELEKSIAEWLRKMHAAGIKTPVPLEELESHLREEIQQQIRAGATEDRAFEAAVARIGDAKKLREEFAKVEDSKRVRRRELLRRWSVVAGVAFVYCVLGNAWYLGARAGRMEITRVDLLLALGAMAPMLLLGWAGRSMAKILPVIRESRIIVIALVSIFLGSLLFRIFFPVISPANMVHLQIVFLWVLSPMSGFGNCVSAWHERCQAIHRDSYRHV